MVCCTCSSRYLRGGIIRKGGESGMIELLGFVLGLGKVLRTALEILSLNVAVNPIEGSVAVFDNLLHVWRERLEKKYLGVMKKKETVPLAMGTEKNERLASHRP
jgi:hypothetical protein